MVNSGPFDGERSPGSIAKVASWLEEQGLGRPAVSFRLRDWLISRQRYWGAPIPIIHCERCGEVAVPEDQLPVELPDRRRLPAGRGVSARAQRGVREREVPLVRRRGQARDTDTMDTFVDSSWYFFRYCSPGNEERRAVPTRGGRPLDAGVAVHRRRRARDPAPALFAVLHEGAERHGDGLVRPSRSRA